MVYNSLKSYWIWHRKKKAEIENLVRKKRKAIDLMLDELISKEDFKKQTEFYNSEIARLTQPYPKWIFIQNSQAAFIRHIISFPYKRNICIVGGIFII